MKAKLIRRNDSFFLILGTGEKHKLELTDVKEFILNFKKNKFYNSALNLPTIIDFNNYEEEKLIAFINLYGYLCIVDHEVLKDLFAKKEKLYISVKEYAENHGRSEVLIRKLCRENRIKGVVYSGKTWIIPADAPYPKDERYGSKNIINKIK